MATLAQLSKFYDQAPQRVLDALEAELQKQAPSLEERGKANVPVQTGKLRDSIKSTVVRTGDTLSIELSADTPYALEVHERPGPLAGGEPEGGRGPKFLTRVLDFHGREIGEAARQALRQVLQEAKVR